MKDNSHNTILVLKYTNVAVLKIFTKVYQSFNQGNSLSPGATNKQVLGTHYEKFNHFAVNGVVTKKYKSFKTASK
jgi:hypothetical protein